MSFSIGIYDLFAYTIPGILYLYILYTFISKYQDFGIRQLHPFILPEGYGLIIFVLFLVVAHLLGHLFDYFAHWFVFRFPRFAPYKYSEKMLERTKRIHSDINIKFEPQDWGILFTMLRERNMEHARIIDSYEANSIMLRNISFGLFLLAILQMYSLFLNFDIPSAVLIIGLIVFSIIARKRSHVFHTWFITDIFETSLRYGNNLREVLTYDQKNRGTESSPSTKKNSK